MIPSNFNNSVIEEIKKLNAIWQKIPALLKKAFKNQKHYADKGNGEIRFIIKNNYNPIYIISLEFKNMFSIVLNHLLNLLNLI